MIIGCICFGVLFLANTAGWVYIHKTIGIKKLFRESKKNPFFIIL